VKEFGRLVGGKMVEGNDL